MLQILYWLLNPWSYLWREAWLSSFLPENANNFTEGILDFVGFIIYAGYLFLFSGRDVNLGFMSWVLGNERLGQFYSNYVNFANSIAINMVNSESSLCSGFMVKFWCGNIMSFFTKFLGFFCLLEFLIAWGWLSTHCVWNIYWHARWGKEGTLKLVLEYHSLCCELVLSANN